MGSSPKAPAPPDPVATANAQGAANSTAARTEAGLNRYNQTTPFGASTWSQDAANPDKWSNEFKLDPQIQGMLDNYYKTSAQPLQGLDMGALPGVSSFDPSTLPAGATGPRTDNLPAAGTFSTAGMMAAPGELNTFGISNPGAFRAPTGGPGAFEASSAPPGEFQATSTVPGQFSPTGLPQVNALSAQGLGAVRTGEQYRQQAGSGLTNNSGLVRQSQGVASNAGGLAGGQIDRLKELYGKEFNYDGASAMPGADEAARKRIEDAYYNSQTARLNPRFQQEEAEYRSRLANQGITEGSEAYNREMQNFGLSKNDAYSQATNSAITNSTSEMQKLFGMGLASRQQGVSEINEMRALPTREAQAAMGLYGGASGINNQNLQTQIAQAEAAQRMAESASTMDQSIRKQQFGERTAVNDSQLRGNAQAFEQQRSTFDAAMDRQGQEFSQGLEGYQTNLERQGQEFSQGLKGYQANVDKNAQDFSQGLEGYQANVAKNAQDFTQRVTENDTNRENRAAQFGEATAVTGIQQSLRDSQFGENVTLDNAAGARRTNALNEGTQLQEMQENTRAARLQEMLTDRTLATQDRNQILNELMALTSGSQVQAPGGSPVGVAPAPIAQSIYNSYQGQQANAAAASASRNSTIGTVGTVAAAAAMAF